MALTELTKLLVKQETARPPPWGTAHTALAVQDSSASSAKANVQAPGRAARAELAGSFSMHVTRDQDPLLGRGATPATLHMTL